MQVFGAEPQKDGANSIKVRGDVARVNQLPDELVKTVLLLVGNSHRVLVNLLKRLQG